MVILWPEIVQLAIGSAWPSHFGQVIVPSSLGKFRVGYHWIKRMRLARSLVRRRWIVQGAWRSRSYRSILGSAAGQLDNRFPAGQAVIPARQIAICQGLDAMFTVWGRVSSGFPLRLEIRRVSLCHIRSIYEDRIRRMLVLAQRNKQSFSTVESRREHASSICQTSRGRMPLFNRFGLGLLRGLKLSYERHVG